MSKFKNIIDNMTVSEKLAQMTQIMGDCFISEGFGKLMGISYGFDIQEELAWNIGSVLGMGGAEKLKMVQKNYMDKSKLHIPLMFMCDIIHGYRTIFPSPLGMACSWQPELIEKSAVIAAKEAAVSGVHVTFSPMADLARDARWGRAIEGTGEDVLLNSQYAAAFVKGYQGENVGDKYKIAACVKHFAAYGAAMAGRDYNTTDISEYDLKENYLPAYQAAIDAGCKLVMSAFNALNGVPCTGNEWLFKDILRDEMNFKGTVITDCTAVYELIPHGFCENAEQAAERSINAGMDIEMVSTAFFDHVEKLIAEGKIEEAQLDTAVENILKLKDELGLFENPFKDADAQAEAQFVLCDEHRKAAREIAANSLVLLENKNAALPLKSTEKVFITGPYADSKLLLDIWKCEGLEEECVTVYEGLKQKMDCTSYSGCDILDCTETEMAKAVQLASQSDTIILTLGEHSDMSSEAGSRAYLTLPKHQLAFADKIFNLGKKVIVVLFHGRPLELLEIAGQADAIIAAWFPGTEGGNAIADVLVGDFAPVGKLTMSFPYTVGQLPLYYNTLPTGRPMQGDDDTERFRSRYIDAPNRPMYPFGYGLTYTTFHYSNLAISKDVMTSKDKLTISCSIKNTGNRDGVETVQFYLRDMGGSYARPVKMLKGYQHLTIKAGEEITVSFDITLDSLKYHTKDNGFAAESGKFKAFIATDSSVQDAVDFELVAD